MTEKQTRKQLIAEFEDFLDAQSQQAAEGATGGIERFDTAEGLHEEDHWGLLDEEAHERGTVDEEHLLITRSGTQYPRPIPPSLSGDNLPVSTPSTSMNNLGTNPDPNAGHNPTSQGSGAAPPPAPPQVSAPIKVMPSGASVREFTHEDGDDYNARDFIQLCENVMRNSSITDPADKIAFVQARVKHGSEASLLMRVSAITQPTKAQDYNTFRHQFLQIFGENVKHSLVKGVHLAAERIIAKVDSQSADRAMVDANLISEDMVMFLRDNKWLQAGHMSEENLLQFLEFFIYMLELKGKIRKGSQELTYGPNDKLYEFVAKIKAKKDATLGETALISPVVEATKVTSGIAALNLASTHSTNSTTPKQTVACSYCKKPGHHEGRCFAKRRDTKAQQPGGASSTPTPAPSHPPSYRDRRQSPADCNKRPPQRSYAKVTRPQSPRSRGAQGGNPYCLLHETNNHSTENCFTMAKLRKDMWEQGHRRVHGSPSGEAVRPKKHDPT